MALTENIGSNQAGKFGNIRTYTAGANIWRGATVVLRSDGLAYPATEDISDTYKQIVVGWALERATTAGSVRVRRDGQLSRKFPGCTAAAIGKLALVKDDDTVQTFDAAAGKIVAGRIASIYIDSAEVFVDFVDRPVRKASGLYD